MENDYVVSLVRAKLIMPLITPFNITERTAT